MTEESLLAKLTEPVMALVDSKEARAHSNPNKTVYDLKTKSIKIDTLVMVIKGCSDSRSSLIYFDNELYWVTSDSLKVLL